MACKRGCVALVSPVIFNESFITNSLIGLTLVAIGLALFSHSYSRHQHIYQYGYSLFFSCFVGIITIGMLSNQVTAIAALLLVLYATVLKSYAFFKHRVIHCLLYGVVIIFSLALIAHSLPGFSRQLVIEDVFAGQTKIPWSLYFSLDKAMVGALLLTFIINKNKQKVRFKHTIECLLTVCAALVILFTLASLGPLSYQSKVLTQNLFVFLVFNLFFTVIAEEGFFRLLIQRPLAEFLQTYCDTKIAGLVSLVTVSLLFTLVHVAWVSELSFLVFVFLAALLYAYTFYKTESVVYASLVHFSVNAVHILLFSYPL